MYVDDNLIAATGFYEDDPPELRFRGNAYANAESVIMWRYGCVAYELCLGKPLIIDWPQDICLYFLENGEKSTQWVDNTKVRAYVNEINNKISKEVEVLNRLEKTLITRCLQVCPQQRATIQEAMSILNKSFIVPLRPTHPWC